MFLFVLFCLGFVGQIFDLSQPFVFFWGGEGTKLMYQDHQLQVRCFVNEYSEAKAKTSGNMEMFVPAQPKGCCFDDS